MTFSFVEYLIRFIFYIQQWIKPSHSSCNIHVIPNNPLRKRITIAALFDAVGFV